MRNFNELEALVLLNSIYSTDVSKIHPLREVFGSCNQMLSDSGLKDLKSSGRYGLWLAGAIKKKLEKFDPAKEIEDCAANGVDLLTYYDNDYPERLRQISDPPLVLYIKGDRSLLSSDSIAIVGSRKSSVYGRKMAETFGYDLAGEDICVVSGLAAGIDSYGHKGALRADNGGTVAVLGCGADVIYPASNRQLYQDVCENGAVISEYPLRSRPSVHSFPRRNRIIAGLSRAVIVVEAAQKSGSLITARLALEEGRDVYAVPGQVDSFFAQGTNALIKEGAMLVSSAADVISDVFFERKKPEENNACKDLPLLDQDQERIVALLTEGVQEIDALAENSGMDQGKLFSILTQLEIQKVIRRVPGGMFDVLV